MKPTIKYNLHIEEIRKKNAELFYQTWNKIDIGDAIKSDFIKDFLENEHMKVLAPLGMNFLVKVKCAKKHKIDNNQYIYIKEKNYKFEEYGKITDENLLKKFKNKKGEIIKMKKKHGEELTKFVQIWNMFEVDEEITLEYVRELFENKHMKKIVPKYLNYMVRRNCAIQIGFKKKELKFIKKKDYNSTIIKNILDNRKRNETNISQESQNLPSQNLPSQMNSHTIGENIFLFMTKQSEKIEELIDKSENLNKLYTNLKGTYDDLFDKHKSLGEDYRKLLSEKSELENLSFKRVEEINKLSKIINTTTGKVFDFNRGEGRFQS